MFRRKKVFLVLFSLFLLILLMTLHSKISQPSKEKYTHRSLDVHEPATPLKPPELARYPVDTPTDTKEYKCETLDPPISKLQNCTEKHCKEFLSSTDKRSMQFCQSGVFHLKGKTSVHENDCNFVDGSNRLPVALVSAQGSGNTWTRGLLEKVTGICTGFLECDYEMLAAGFIGEGVRSGSALVIKTHRRFPMWHGKSNLENTLGDPEYGSAILLVRNPFDATVAEWNRRVTNEMLTSVPHNESHTNIIPKEFWNTSDFDQFVHRFNKIWKVRIDNWVIQKQPRPVLVVRYEDLKRDTAHEVARMLDFLKVDYVSEDDIQRRLCQDFTQFKRAHRKQDNFDHFSPEQREYITSVIKEVIKASELANKTLLDQLRLHEYLPHVGITVA